MNLLREHEVRQDPARLDAAWETSGSFALVPDKPGVSDEWLARALEAVPAPLDRGHFVLLTSGSTGAPKLVVGHRGRAERLAGVLHEQQDAGPVTETVLALPLSYSFAFVNQWLWSRTQGRRLRITGGLSDPGALRDVLASASDAMICLVGIQVPLLMQWLGDAAFPGIIRIHFAGGRFPQERLDALRKLFPRAQVFNNYGCAEAMPRLTLRRAEASDDAAHIGQPLPGVELRSGEGQALVFRSPYRAVGVVEAGVFHPIADEDWVPTGDLGEPAGPDTWRLLGRAGEVFKRHGEKVSLHALTATITAAWPGQCAWYRERDRLGEDGCVLVLAPAPADGQLSSVLLALRKHHPRAHWPLRVETVDTLPSLPNGKPDVGSLAGSTARTVLWQQPI